MLDWLTSKLGKGSAANKAPARRRPTTSSAATSNRPAATSALPRKYEAKLSQDALQRSRDVLLGAVGETLDKVPMLSKAARAAFDASLDVDVTFDQLRAILEQDAGLVATLLQQANSVRYSGAKQAETVMDALGRVGLGGLRDMLMVASSHRILKIPGFPDVTDRLQARGPAVGYCSRQIAECLGIDADAAFTAGLLHDIGWPAAYDTARRVVKHLPAEVQEAGGEGLMLVAEYTHQNVGQRLAHTWNLGSRTVSAVGNHHDPASSPMQGRETAWVVACAMALVDSVGWYPETRVPDVLASPIVQAVKLSPTQVAQLTRTLRRDLELNAAPEAVA